MQQLDEFTHEFRLSQVHAARVLGRSPRTLRRWRRRGRIPEHARNMIEVCSEQRAPINHSLHRGPWYGCDIRAWRERLFGPQWKDWRPSGRTAHHRRRRLPL